MVRIPAWPDKDPDEVLDYAVDWSNRLAVGESISTSTFSIVRGAVTIDSDSDDGTTATVWLSGGDGGETCQVLNRIVTNSNRTFDQTMSLRISTR